MVFCCNIPSSEVFLPFQLQWTYYFNIFSIVPVNNGHIPSQRVIGLSIEKTVDKLVFLSLSTVFHLPILLNAFLLRFSIEL